MRRVLVTGAGGFVGGHLLAALRQAFPDAVLTGTSLDDRDGFVRLDVTDAGAVGALMAETRPDACVHLAAIAAIGAARDDPARAWAVNLGGTLNVARAMRAEAPEGTLLFVSSSDVYGASFASGRSLDEGAVLAPMNAYAATKAAADLALGAMVVEGLRVVRARPFNHAGPGQGPGFAVADFCSQIAAIKAGRAEPVLRVGRLDPSRDFSDVRDVVEAYVAILSHFGDLAPGTILNIASGVPRRIGDVLDVLVSMAGVRVTIESAPALVRPTDIPLAIGDASRARSLLGWQPVVPWEATLRDALAAAERSISPGA